MRNEMFDKAVEEILKKDPTYPACAYSLVASALEYTVRRVTTKNHHVTGRQLSEGLRDYMLEEYGPFAQDILRKCNMQQTFDIGRIVYNLIEVGAFGKTKEDSIEDFNAIYDFVETFEKPFKPLYY